MSFKQSCARTVQFICLGVLTGVAAQAATPNSGTQLSAHKIDQAAVSAIRKWNGKKTIILSHIDLTQPFNAKSQWALVVVRHLTAPVGYLGMKHGMGPIAVCFVKQGSPQCSERNGPHSANLDPAYSTMWVLLQDRVVYAGQKKTQPLLWLKTCSVGSGDGNCDKWAALYQYDRNANVFHPVFSYLTGGSNNNQNARFISQGPIQGDVVVDYPAEHPPYTYWVEVYAPGKNGQYKRILKYKGHTGYGDGNFLPVAYSEMPEILRHLGYWKQGDALPVPPGIDCPHPVLRHQEEWCN